MLQEWGKGEVGVRVRIWRPQDGLLEPGELSKVLKEELETGMPTPTPCSGGNTSQEEGSSGASDGGTARPVWLQHSENARGERRHVIREVGSWLCRPVGQHGSICFTQSKLGGCCRLWRRGISLTYILEGPSGSWVGKRLKEAMVKAG